MSDPWAKDVEALVRDFGLATNPLDATFDPIKAEIEHRGLTVDAASWAGESWETVGGVQTIVHLRDKQGHEVARCIAEHPRPATI